MPLKTENEYEDLFGDHIALLTGLDRDSLVRPMKQTNGTRVAKRFGNLLQGFKPSDDWVAYHVKFSEDFEEPYTVPSQDKVIAKRFLRVEYNFYGPNAANNILTFKQLLYTQKSYEELIKNGIVYSIVQANVVDMDEMINEQWWNRRILSINYLESVEIEFPSGTVQEVDATDIIVTKI